MQAITLDGIVQRCIFLHGLSGAGKSELVQALRKNLGDRSGFHFSTGDYFRKLKANLEVRGKMRQGFVPTLNDIVPLMVNDLKNVLLRWARGEDMVIVFDGAVRFGEYERDGKIIPSQFEQLAETWKKAIKLAKRSSIFRDKLDIELASAIVEGISSYGFPNEFLGEITFEKIMAQMFREISVHNLVDVTREGAQQLMRLRLHKNLAKLAESLRKNNEKVNSKVADCCEIASQILAGRVIVQNEKVEVVSSDETYVPVSVDETTLGLMEKALDDLKREAANAFGVDEKETFIETIEQTLGDEGFRGIEVRFDDERKVNRDERVDQFIKSTLTGVLVSELEYGYDTTTGEVSQPGGTRLRMINGPDRGISYQELTDQIAPQMARMILRRVFPDRFEVGIVG